MNITYIRIINITYIRYIRLKSIPKQIWSEPKLRLTKINESNQINLYSEADWNLTSKQEMNLT